MSALSRSAVSLSRRSEPAAVAKSATSVGGSLLDDPGFVHLVRWTLTARLICLVLATPSAMLGPSSNAIASASVAALVLGSFVISRSASMIRSLLRHPLLASFDVACTVLLLVSLPTDQPAALTVVCSALLAGLLFPRRVLVLLMVPLVLGSFGAPAALVAGGHRSWQSVLALVAGLPALALGVCSIGAVVRRSFEALLRARTEVAEAVAAVGAANERARLARDMHDSVGKSLHGIALGARALVRTVDQDPALAAELAGSLGDAADRAGAEARTLLLALRDDADDRPTVEDLRRIARQWEQTTGTAACFSAVDAVDTSPAVARQLRAVLGEALHNVAKHAKAGRVEITVTGGAASVELVVRDDGTGFDPGRRTATEATGHFGLRGLCERAEAVGGHAEIDSSPGQGTTVRWTAPRCPPEH